MDYIYVRKSEILKKEIIENIKANLFNKKKAIEEGLTKGIFSNGNIPVKYKDKKYHQSKQEVDRCRHYL